MRLLLSSAGATNATITDALVGLLGKPISESTALCIPTAAYPNGPGGAWAFAAGAEPRCPMVGLGWRSVGMLELTALPSLDRGSWEPAVRGADAILVNGGDALYLAHWMRESGFADLMGEMQDTVYFGLSAGSMVLAPAIGREFVGWQPPGGGHRALGVVGFSIFPHLDHPDLTENTMTAAVEWAAALPNPGYAIDDATAIRVVDGVVDVVTEGHWRLFA